MASRFSWTREMTGAQWTILIVAWLGWVFDIMDTALFNFAKQPMLIQMLGQAEYNARGKIIEGTIQMVFLIGWALGGLFFGILADRWGRTRTLIVTILLYSLLTGATAFCTTWEQVAILRFFTALGIGGEWAAGAALVAEALPNRARAGAAAILQSAAAVGPWLAAILNLVIPVGTFQLLGTTLQGWQALFLAGVLPAIICVIIRARVKEPERVTAIRTLAERKEGVLSGLRDLFAHPTWRKHAIIATVLGVVGVTGAGILPFWQPNLVTEAAQGLSDEAVKNFKSYNLFTFHIGTLLGVFAFPWIAERIGRRRAFGVFFVMSPIATAAALYGGATLDRLMWLLPVAAFFTIGLSAGFVLYFPELFPARMRATGAGLAYNVGRVVSAPMPRWIGGAIDANGGHAGPVVVGAAAIVYLIGLIALPFAPETRGKELPEETPPDRGV